VMSLNVLKNSRIWLKMRHEGASRFSVKSRRVEYTLWEIHYGHSSGIEKIMGFNKIL
jgi:hypothetical protein